MAAVELRVHGVGGSTPEHLLSSAFATRVAGDADAGFYVAGDPDLEGYCWGDLTSGAATRALWLLMLPFTLVNASFWMGPRRRLGEALVRLLALSLTATALLAAEGVGTDLLGWQCAARDACRRRHTWLRWLGSGTMATPGRRVVVGAAIPLGVLALLWLLARRTARYERAVPDVPGGPGPLEDPTFWYGARQVDRLRELHVAVGLAVVGLGLAWPLLRHDDGGLQVLDAVLVAGAWLVMLISSAAVCLPAVVRRDPPGTTGVRWPVQVQRAGLLLVLAAALVAFLPARPGWEAHGSLPGYDGAVAAVFLAQLAGVAVLAAAVWPHRDRAAAALGLTQPVFAALGLLMASVLSAGLTFRFADWLDGAGTPTDGTLDLPDAYSWAALTLLVVAVPVVLGLVLVVLRRLRSAERRARVEVRADYAQPAGEDARVAALARTRAVAGLPDPALGWIAWVTAVSLVAAVASMALTIAATDTPAGSVDPGTLQDLLRFGTLGGTWLVSGAAALVLVVGYRSYRGASLRKHVGILWDLGTFWPRAAHPLAPPCYVERCLPDLTTRVTYLVEQRGGVVLSAHSQGTVIAAALVWQLPADVLERVRLITYGSPLARLYGRTYSAWFGPAEVAELQQRVGEGRWANLWRTTDWIGGPVGTPADLQVRRDPPLLGPAPGDPAAEAPHGHFDYELTEQYAEVLRQQRASLSEPGATVVA